MREIVIFGAGQAGKMMGRLMHHGRQRVLAFADNNQAHWGKTIDGIPVVSLEEAVGRHPDAIQIAIVNPEACASIENALRQGGYTGEIDQLDQWKERFSVRVAALRLMAEELKGRDVPGALAELGVYQGEFAAEMNVLFPKRPIYLFDTFTGFDQRDVETEAASGAKEGDFGDTSVDLVLERLPHPEMAQVRKGYFPETAKGLEDVRYAMVSLDADLYQPMYQGLNYFYPRMSPGGYLILHDYNNAQFPGSKEGVQAFCRENNVYVFPLCDLHGTGIIIKT